MDILPRGLALFLGGFSLLNMLGGFFAPGFDANLWWIDLRWFPAPVADSFLLISSVCLLVYAVQPPRVAGGRVCIAGVAGVLATATFMNAIGFYALLFQGHVASRLPIPLSLLLTAGLTLICIGAARNARNSPQSQPVLSFLLGPVAVSAICLFLFPLAQMFCFGKTDYERPADIAVVFGARVYADGRPSDALADRVRTACRLYQQGEVNKLLFSGGPGDGATPETLAMKQMAVQLGVRPEDILVDDKGLNTLATVRNTERMFSQLKPRRILAVSHFYHLPRIKLAYQRAGFEVYTVPAKESYLLRQMPYNMAREIAALWVYYFRSA